jgi:hypothetical protein
MKITVSQLRRIIKEEVSRMLHEEEKLMEDVDQDKVAKWITNLSVTADDSRIPRKPEYHKHYMIFGNDLGLTVLLYNAILNQKGKMDELLGLLPPGGEIKSYSSEPPGVGFMDVRKGPVDTYVPGSRE